MKKKLRKFITKPGVFFRDFLNKRYPIINNELRCIEENESAIIQHTFSQEKDLFNRHDLLPVDVVYTWVNKNRAWEEDFCFHKKRIEEREIGQYGMNDARFEDNNELLYSLKSIRKNIPWVNKIFIVTNNRHDLPSYLIADDIIIITHEEIIDVEYLPTFNSHVIEAFLYKIPNLSEHFIYFNDDVFVARPLSKEHFFQSNGLAAFFLSSKRIDGMYEKGTHTPSLLASLYSQKLLSREFDYYINQILVHTYVPLKRSMYELAWELYEAEIVVFLKNRFRGNKDINMATFLVPWLMYICSHSSVKTDICYYFNVRSPHAKQQYLRLLHKKEEERPHSICANDFCFIGTENEEADYKKNLNLFLKRYFD